MCFCEGSTADQSELQFAGKLPCFCEELIPVGSSHVIARTQQGRLYYDQTLLCSNVTSMKRLQDTFVYIVNDIIPRLCFLPIAELSSFSTSTSSGIPHGSFASRALERGSVMIAVSREGRVVVQLPRGNLESFYPRYLSCHQLWKLVYEGSDPLRWKTAVELMRRQRIRRVLFFL